MKRLLLFVFMFFIGYEIQGNYKCCMHNKQHIAIALYDIGAIQFGDFTLKGGHKSPIYIDLRRVISYPLLLDEMCTLLRGSVQTVPSLICGIALAGVPFATALSLKYTIPMIMYRSNKKAYKHKHMIEGVFKPGDSCIVLDDLVTSGKSIISTIQTLQDAGLVVNDIIVVLDRQQGGLEYINQQGYNIHAIFTMQELLTMLHLAGRIDEDIIKKTVSFIHAHETEIS